jgi:hypothetical protein
MDRIGLLGFSVIGVVFLVLLTRWLGFAKVPRLTSPERAAELAQAAIPGLIIVETALSVDKMAALVAGTDGRVALVRPFGDRFVVRVLSHPLVIRAGSVLRIRTREFMFPETALDLGPAASMWAARL